MLAVINSGFKKDSMVIDHFFCIYGKLLSREQAFAFKCLLNTEGSLFVKKGGFMAKSRGASCKTHSKKQLEDYANQHNPNNKAYKANISNRSALNRHSSKIAYVTDLEWMCYSKGAYEFD